MQNYCINSLQFIHYLQKNLKKKTWGRYCFVIVFSGEIRYHSVSGETSEVVLLFTSFLLSFLSFSFLLYFPCHLIQIGRRLQPFVRLKPPACLRQKKFLPVYNLLPLTISPFPIPLPRRMHGQINIRAAKTLPGYLCNMPINIVVYMVFPRIAKPPNKVRFAGIFLCRKTKRRRRAFSRQE